MQAVYIISVIALFLSIFILKRNNKKENALITFVYTWGILYFLSSLEAFVLSYIGIKNTLISFSIINLILTSVLTYKNYRKDSKLTFQKYYVNKKHIVSALIIIVISIAIGAYRYDGYKTINYKVNDAAVHYKLSSDYEKYQKLYDNNYKDELYSFNRTMFGYYVPCGIFMQIMPVKHYVSYDIFNVSMLIMLSLTFYVTCLSIKKDGDKKNIISLLIVLLYTLAYPLDYMIFGFGYLGSGILATNLVILTWILINKYNSKMLYILLLLFNLGLFFSYYLFVPAVYLSEGLYIIYSFVKGKYSLKSMFKIGISTLLIPAIIGFLYFVYNKNGTKEALGGYSIDGYSYKNLYSNFVLLIPLIIYSITMKFKNKKIDFSLFFLLSEIFYILVTLIFIPKGSVSPYYFYKTYYILWLGVYLIIYELINYKEYNFILRINIGFVIFIILFAAFNIEGLVYKINFNLTNTVTSKELSNVYQFNIGNFDKSTLIKKEEMKLLAKTSKYSKECGINNKMKKLPYISGYAQKLWFFAINNMIPAIDYKDKLLTDIFTSIPASSEIEKDKEVQCVLISDDYIKKSLKNYSINYDNYEVLYKNKAGKLLKKKILQN